MPYTLLKACKTGALRTTEASAQLTLRSAAWRTWLAGARQSGHMGFGRRRVCKAQIWQHAVYPVVFIDLEAV